MKLTTSIKRKAKAESVMFNGYIDVAEFNNFKFFVSGGVGVAILREKISAATNLVVGNETFPLLSDSGSTKVAKNFAYSLTLGTSAKVADNVHAVLSYTYKDYGKTKSAKYAGVEFGKTPYKSHAVTAGLRLDL